VGTGQIHATPAEDWSLDALARIAGLSRTAFADRFERVVVLAPIQYVTLWRMRRVRLLLAESEWTIDRVAEQVGYESAAALSRVFKRWVGEPPGRYRRSARGDSRPAARCARERVRATNRPEVEDLVDLRLERLEAFRGDGGPLSWSLSGLFDRCGRRRDDA